jgi:hypothetical protein
MALSVRSATAAFSRVATAARPAQRQYSVVVRAGQINPDIKKDVEKVQQQLVATCGKGLCTHPPRSLAVQTAFLTHSTAYQRTGCLSLALTAV